MTQAEYNNLQLQVMALDEQIHTMVSGGAVPTNDPQDHNEMFQSPIDVWNAKLAALQVRRAALVAQRDGAAQ